jgi:hypothetical protein
LEIFGILLVIIHGLAHRDDVGHDAGKTWSLCLAG